MKKLRGKFVGGLESRVVMMSLHPVQRGEGERKSVCKGGETALGVRRCTAAQSSFHIGRAKSRLRVRKGLRASSSLRRSVVMQQPMQHVPLEDTSQQRPIQS